MNFKAQLADIAEKVQIVDVEHYRVNGQPRQVYHQQAWMDYVGPLNLFGQNRPTDRNLQKSKLKQHLTNTLYGEFYCGMSKDKISAATPSAQQRQQFMQTLSQHNHSANTDDKGWCIYHIDKSGQVFAKKNGLLRQAISNTFFMATPGAKLAINQMIHFKRQKENTKAQTVFYFVHGNTFMEQGVPQVRVYWHIESQGATKLVQWLSTVLNQYQLPFNFKCLNHDDLFNRRDSAVLYIEKRYFDFTMRLLKGCPPEVKQHLQPAAPLFTLPIFEGVSFAEDPGNGESFGMNRCQWIAEALMLAFERGQQTPAEQLATIMAVFADKGVEVDRLHLNPHTLSVPVSFTPKTERTAQESSHE